MQATIAAINKKGAGASTFILVDMLGHPAVELTQAENAITIDSAPAKVSGFDDIIVLAVGILTGCASCAILLFLVYFILKRRKRSRNFLRNRSNDKKFENNYSVGDLNLQGIIIFFYIILTKSFNYKLQYEKKFNCIYITLNKFIICI